MAEDKTKRDTRSIPKQEIEWALSILKDEYEKKLGITIKVEADCIIVCDKLIEFPDKKYPLAPGVKEPVSLRVIKRIFDITPYKEGFTFKTLSIMVHFLGYKDWDDFIDSNLSEEKFAIGVASDISRVNPTKLEKDEIIKLELKSGKYSILKHLDEFAYFEVLEMKGMMKTQGTKFWSLGFEVVEDKNGNQIIKLTEDDWFEHQIKEEDDENSDLKDKAYYFL